MRDEVVNEACPAYQSKRRGFAAATHQQLIWKTIHSLIFADAEVMRYLPKRDLAPRERAERTIAFFNDHWSRCGYGVWAVTDKITGEFIGHCGLNFVPEAEEVEVLYALRKDHWGQGIATEAARASVRFGI